MHTNVRNYRVLFLGEYGNGDTVRICLFHGVCSIVIAIDQATRLLCTLHSGEVLRVGAAGRASGCQFQLSLLDAMFSFLCS